MPVLLLDDYRGRRKEEEILDTIRKIQDAQNRAAQITQELKALVSRLDILMLDNTSQ